MTALTRSQRLILVTAVERADGAVLPLPDELARRGQVMILKSLLARGLIAARPAQPDQPVWPAGSDQTLAITSEGRARIDAERQAPAKRKTGRRKAPDRRRRVVAAPGPAVAIRPGTKQALVVEMLGRPEGASIGEIQAATGWLPHTARAALTGLRHKGFTLTSAKRANGTRAYHGPSGATADAPDQAG